MRKRKALLPILLTILVLIGSGTSSYFIYDKWSSHPLDTTSSIVQEVKSTSEAQEKDLKSIIHESQKNVVQIEAKGEWGSNIGSGFLYNNKGDIITNAHVVKDADSIYVKTANARNYPAALIGIGDNLDIAVIRVPQLAGRSPIEIDDKTDAEIGDEIIVSGSPLGLQNSFTIGIISGTERTLTIDNFKYENAYQISAPITHGNSGGPLILRDSGKVIGINSAGTDQGTIGFSIPIKNVIDKVRMWSDKADNKELNYDGQTSPYEKTNPDQLKDDASYLVSYFYESLLIRDYINAYALLGSTIQGKTSYQQFREDYIHIIDITITDVQTEIDDNNRVHISLKTDNVIRKSDQTTVTERYDCQYIIGYENDQLKILEENRTLVSSTEHIQTDDQQVND